MSKRKQVFLFGITACIHLACSDGSNSQPFSLAGENQGGKKSMREQTSRNSDSEGPNAPNGDKNHGATSQGVLKSKQKARPALFLNVDVAESSIKFAPLDTDFIVNWKKGANCEKIEVIETSKGVEVKHVDKDESCGGSSVSFTIREGLATSFKGGAGQVDVLGTSQLIRKGTRIDGSVMAGSIRSSLKEIVIDRKYSQSYATYEPETQTEFLLEVALGAGNIDFQK